MELLHLSDIVVPEAWCLKMFTQVDEKPFADVGT